MSVQAYQRAASRAEPPRQTEYRLLGQVTRALMSAAELDRSNITERMDALDWNRRVWSTFANDCAGDDNGLPDGLRANIISLAIFVSKHTSAVMRQGADIQPLIDINRSVMAGLETGAANANAAASGAGAPN